MPHNHMIEAALDMYEALKGLCAEYESWKLSGENKFTHEATAKAYNAILKAEGKFGIEMVN